MTRIKELPQESLTAKQQAIHDRILEGPLADRGFADLLLYSPLLASRVEALGRCLHLDCNLPPALIEVVILTTARYWQSAPLFRRHAILAANLLIPDHTIQALRRGLLPLFVQDSEEAAYKLVSELLEKKIVSDKIWTVAASIFKEKDILAVLSIAGFYGTVCMTLNASHVSVPEPEFFRSH